MKDNEQYCPYCMTPVPEGGPCPVCGLTSGTYTPQPHHLRPGTVLLDRYLVGRVLGEGGFGITYIGCDLRLELKVAIKEYYPVDKAARNAAVSPELVSYSIGSSKDGFERGKRKFLNEARTMAKMDKQQVIVSAKDFFETNNTAYIVMEYIEGTTFTELVAQKGGRIPPNELFPMIEPLFKALSVVHKNGLIHRDISPDNLMLEDGDVRLIDFGCARETERGNETLTITLKHGYAPIEQYQHKGQGPWTDVYALCATIYYCLVGQKPPQALDRIGVDDGLLLPSKLGVPITPGQEAALLKGLNLSPRGRFQTMEELQGALYPPTPEPEPKPDPKPDPRPEAKPEPKPEPRPEPEPKPEPKPKPKSKPKSKYLRYLPWMGVAAAVLVLAVLIACLLPKGDGAVLPPVTVAPADRFENAYTLRDFDYSTEDLRQLMEDPAVESLILPAGAKITIDYLENGEILTLTKPLRVMEDAFVVCSALSIDGEGYLEVKGILNLTGTGDLRLKGEAQRISFPKGVSDHLYGAAGSLWLESGQNLLAGDLTYFTEQGSYAFTCKEDLESAKEVTTLQELRNAAVEKPSQGIRITQNITLNQNLTFECPVYICQGVTVSANVAEYGLCLNHGGVLINHGTFQGNLWAGENAAVLNYGTMGLGTGQPGVSLWFSEGGENVLLNFGSLVLDNVSRLWPDNHMINLASGVVEAKNFYVLGTGMDNCGQIYVSGDWEGFYIGKGGWLSNRSSGTITVPENGELLNLGKIDNNGTITIEDGGRFENTIFRNDDGVFRASENAQKAREPQVDIYLVRSGEVDIACDGNIKIFQIPPEDEVQGGKAVYTEETLRTLLEDDSVERITVSGNLVCHGNLTLKGKLLYLTGSLTVEDGTLWAEDSTLYLDNGGVLEADSILLNNDTMAMMTDSRVTVRQGGVLDLFQSLIWGLGGEYLKAENAEVRLYQSAIAVEYSASGQNFLQMDNSTIRVDYNSMLMPAFHDDTVLSGVNFVLDKSSTLAAGRCLELRDSTVTLKMGSVLKNSSDHLTLENCVLDIRQFGTLQSEYSDLNLVNTTVKNRGTFFTGGWMEHRLTLTGGSFTNTGECHLFGEVALLEDAMITNWGKLYYASDAHDLDLSKVTGNNPINQS